MKQTETDGPVESGDVSAFDVEWGIVMDALCSRYASWYPEKEPMAFMHDHYALVLTSPEPALDAALRLAQAESPPFPPDTPNGLPIAVLASMFCRDAQHGYEEGRHEAAWSALCMANRLLGMLEGHSTGPEQLRIARQFAGRRGAEVKHEEDAAERAYVQRWFHENRRSVTSKDKAAEILTGASGGRPHVHAKWSTVRRWLKGLPDRS